MDTFEPGQRPEVTPEMRENARAHPNSWLYVIDPNFTGTEAGAAEIVGAFPVNAAGEIEDDFQPNPEYKPLPGGPLDRTLELISTGAGDRDELLAAILDARLLVYAESTGDRSVTGFPSADGRVMVPACTSADHVPPAWPGWREVTGHELVPLLNGNPLVINPVGPVTVLIPADQLAGASASAKASAKAKTAKQS